MTERAVPGLIQDPIEARKAKKEAKSTRKRELDQVNELTIRLSRRARELIAQHWTPSEAPTRGPHDMTDEAVKEAIRSVERDSTGTREARQYKLGVIFPILTEDGKKDVKLAVKIPLELMSMLSRGKIRIDIPGQPHTFDSDRSDVHAVSRAEVTTRVGYPDSQPEYDRRITLDQAKGLAELLDFIEDGSTNGTIVPKSFGQLSVPTEHRGTMQDPSDYFRVLDGNTRTPSERLEHLESRRRVRETEARLR